MRTRTGYPRGTRFEGPGRSVAYDGWAVWAIEPGEKRHVWRVFGTEREAAEALRDIRRMHGDTKVRYTEFVARAVAIYVKRGVGRAEAERLTAKRYGLSVREVRSICVSMRAHGNAAKKKYPLNTYEKHQLAIARKTLRMPDAMAGVMGMTKADARWTILVLGQKLSKAEKG